MTIDHYFVTRSGLQFDDIIYWIKRDFKRKTEHKEVIIKAMIKREIFCANDIIKDVAKDNKCCRATIYNCIDYMLREGFIEQTHETFK
jgi:Fe2+ or Zn2+ uptake regulation protein